MPDPTDIPGPRVGRHSRNPLPLAVSCLAAAAIAGSLAACGGGGGGVSSTTPPLVERPEPPLMPLPALPPQRVQDAGNAPVLYVDRNIHIGPDVAPSHLPDRLLGEQDDIAISYGPARDGVGAERLIAFLADDAQDNNPDPDQGIYIHRFASPPTVRIARDASPRMLDLTVRALHMINTALPHDWQLRIDPVPGPRDPAAFDDPPAGEILIQFAALADWPVYVQFSEYSAGVARTPYTNIGSITSASILVDHTRDDLSDRDTLGTIVHEIIHTLGRGHPSLAFRDHSVMGGSQRRIHHILSPLDREALLAVYGRLQPGSTVAFLADDLGPWSDTSTHLLGEFSAGGEDVSFGVAFRNGLAQPWATGPAPLTNLADNAELSGSTTWSGRLLGFTPDAEPVAGAADLTIALGTFDGDLQFTELEHWSAGDAPGAAGSGTVWGDGDLRYAIDVRGNTFTRSAGDEGIVTGAFLGTQHQAMGGTLQRDDLSAAFGGSR